MNTQNVAIDYYRTSLHSLPPRCEPTPPTDLCSPFACDVEHPGVFDLCDDSSTALGKLLDALPVPALLIDQWFCVAFVNHSCEQLDTTFEDMKGSRFTDLLAYPENPARAHSLKTKGMTLLERVFADTSPQTAEAILEIGKHRIWARLHLRSVRVVSDRHIMVIIEDVTSERTHQHAWHKEEEELRKALVESQERIRQVTRELSEIRLEPKRETAQREEATRRLGVCSENKGRNRKRRSKIAKVGEAVPKPRHS